MFVIKNLIVAKSKIFYINSNIKSFAEEKAVR